VKYAVRAAVARKCDTLRRAMMVMAGCICCASAVALIEAADVRRAAIATHAASRKRPLQTKIGVACDLGGRAAEAGGARHQDCVGQRLVGARKAMHSSISAAISARRMVRPPAAMQVAGRVIVALVAGCADSNSLSAVRVLEVSRAPAQQRVAGAAGEFKRVQPMQALLPKN